MARYYTLDEYSETKTGRRVVGFANDLGIRIEYNRSRRGYAWAYVEERRITVPRERYSLRDWTLLLCHEGAHITCPDELNGKQVVHGKPWQEEAEEWRRAVAPRYRVARWTRWTPEG